MRFQEVVDGIAQMTCVMSVEKKEGGYGKICIVAGNKAYIESIENPQDGVVMNEREFIPGSEYTTYLEKDLNFEDACYRAAVLKKCVHAYVHPERFPVWFNINMLPLAPDDGDICYCTYTMEVNTVQDTEEMSNVSSDIAVKVLETCIRLRGTEDFHGTMQEIIDDIRKLCEAEHCCILMMDPIKRKCSVLCEQFREGSKLFPMEHYLDEGFYDIAESWMDTIAGSDCIIANNDASMAVVKERNPVWYESLSQAGAKSIVLFPLKSRNELLGYIWALNFEQEDTGKIKEALELTTFILASEIANYELLDRLKILSSRDMLTGVNNRNEMNNLVDELSRGDRDEDQTVGVAFADLNGLKDINDERGHDAGDKLLKDAASALKRVFGNECIFRAGGDEFSIIITGITEEELKDKVEMLRSISSEYENVNFAIGMSVVNKTVNVRTALREADERMYVDKEKYYAGHPELKRRGK